MSGLHIGSGFREQGGGFSKNPRGAFSEDKGGFPIGRGGAFKGFDEAFRAPKGSQGKAYLENLLANIEIDEAEEAEAPKGPVEEIKDLVLTPEETGLLGAPLILPPGEVSTTEAGLDIKEIKEKVEETQKTMDEIMGQRGKLNAVLFKLAQAKAPHSQVQPYREALDKQYDLYDKYFARKGAYNKIIDLKSGPPKDPLSGALSPPGGSEKK